MIMPSRHRKVIPIMKSKKTNRLNEAKNILLFERIKKVVEKYKCELNVSLKELQDFIQYKKIEKIEDPILFDFSNKIAHNENTIQTCTKL